MVKRSVEAWRLLFAEQESSGLTAARFCRERKLCPKYFSLRKKQLGWVGDGVEMEKRIPARVPSAFVRVARVPTERANGPCALMRLGGCEWVFEDVSPTWLAEWMKAFA